MDYLKNKHSRGYQVLVGGRAAAGGGVSGRGTRVGGYSTSRSRASSWRQQPEQGWGVGSACCCCRSVYAIDRAQYRVGSEALFSVARKLCGVRQRRHALTRHSTNIMVCCDGRGEDNDNDSLNYDRAYNKPIPLLFFLCLIFALSLSPEFIVMLCSPMDAARQSIAEPKPLLSNQSISSPAWFQLRVALRAVHVKTILGIELCV